MTSRPRAKKHQLGPEHHLQKKLILLCVRWRRARRRSPLIQLC